jgi:hypothetical protein
VLVSPANEVATPWVYPISNSFCSAAVPFQGLLALCVHMIPSYFKHVCDIPSHCITNFPATASHPEMPATVISKAHKLNVCTDQDKSIVNCRLAHQIHITQPHALRNGLPSNC